jgi:plastocyanin
MRHRLIVAFMTLGWVAGVCAERNQAEAQLYYSAYYYPAEPVVYYSYYTPVSYSSPVYYSYYSPSTYYAPTVYCEPTYASGQSYASEQSYSSDQSYATQQLPESSYSVARPAPAKAATTVNVGAYDNRFSPQTVNVQPGTTVRWVNYGQHPHTVTANNGSWDSGDIKPGAAYSATFTRPGSYHYYCRHHTRDRMQGVVIVASTATNGGGAQASGY